MITHRLWDTQENSWVNIPSSEFSRVWQTGRYQMRKSDRIPVVLGDGRVGDVDATDFDSVIQTGGSYDIERQQRIDKREFGDQGLKAAALGFASGLTFTLSDIVASKAFGMDPDDLKKLEQYNPTASLVSEVAGGVVPALLSGGTGAVASAARLTPAGASAVASTKAGQFLTQAVRKKAAGAMTKQGFPAAAVRSVSSGGTLAAQAALEGGLYGVGELASETALGDPDANAGKILDHMGFGAAFGGILGVSGSLALSGVKGVSSKISGASKAAGEFREKTIRKLHDDPAGVLDMDPAKVDQVLDDEYIDSLRMTEADKLADSLNAWQGVRQQTIDFLHGDRKKKLIIKTISEDDSLGPDALVKALQAADSSVKLIRGQAKTFGKTKRRRIDAYLKRLEALIEEPIDQANPSQRLGELFHAMDRAKIMISSDANVYKNVARGYELLRNNLQNEKIFGEIGRKQGRINNAWHELIEGDKRASQDFYRRRMKGADDEQLFTTDGRFKESFLRTADPGLIAAKLKSIQNPEAGTYFDEIFYPYLDRHHDFAKTVMETFEDVGVDFDISAGLVKAQSGLKSAQDSLKAFDEVMIARNQVKEFMRNAKNDMAFLGTPGMNIGIDITSRVAGIGVGGLIGGLPGAAVGLAASGFIKSIQDPVQHMRNKARLARLMKRTQGDRDRMRGEIKKLFREKTPKFLKTKSTVQIRGSVIRALGVQLTKEDRKDERSERLALIREVGKMNHLAATQLAEKHLKGLEASAPDHHAALLNHMSRMIATLAGTAKTVGVRRRDLVTGQEIIQASDTALDRFDRIMRVLDSPTKTLTNRLLSGRLSREEVVVAKAAHPQAYADFVQAVTEQVTDPKAKVTYAQKVQLSSLLGIPFAVEMSPQYVMVLQAANGSITPQEEPAPRRGDTRRLTRLATAERL